MSDNTESTTTKVSAVSHTGLAGLGRWLDSIQIVTKAGIVIIGAAYVIGLLILNLHLRKYSVYYLGFLQIEYVMTGMLWAFLMAFTYGLIMAWWEVFTNLRTQLKERRFGWFLFSLVLFYSFFNLYAIVVNFLGEGDNIAFDWKVAGSLLLNVLVIFNLLNTDAIRGRISLKKGRQAFDLLYYVGSTVVILSLYASVVFPKLSPTFGGGKPRSAIFAVKVDQVDAVKAIGLESILAQRQLGPTEVIFEADEFFLIGTPKGFPNDKATAIRVNKDLLDGAFYIKQPAKYRAFPWQQ